MNEPEIPEMTRRSTQIFNEIVKNCCKQARLSALVLSQLQARLTYPLLRCGLLWQSWKGAGYYSRLILRPGACPPGGLAPVCRRADGSARQSGSG